jgi:hypothetical protein
MTDLYHETYQDEVFQSSQCIWHENTLMDFLRSQLISLGYTSTSDSHKVWQGPSGTVVICLVDDFTTCSTNYDCAVPYLFDRNTTVITDNWASVPTQYRVLQLPHSFYGIYAHVPEINCWNPHRRFNFTARRLDAKRMLLFLEIEHRKRLMQLQTDVDYINFNAWSWNGNNHDQQGQQHNFQTQFDLLEPQFRDIYREVFDQLCSQIPIRNHDLSHEQQHTRAWVNLVAETYSSDTCVAVSEKIFRALCLPVPWMVYGGKHTVAYLRSLGFDVVPEHVAHRYDPMVEAKTAAYGDKMVDFVYEAAEAVERLQNLDFDSIQLRYKSAAQHNQYLLARMRETWPRDFANWWNNTVNLLS